VIEDEGLLDSCVPFPAIQNSVLANASNSMLIYAEMRPWDDVL